MIAAARRAPGERPPSYAGSFAVVVVAGTFGRFGARAPPGALAESAGAGALPDGAAVAGSSSRVVDVTGAVSAMVGADGGGVADDTDGAEVTVAGGPDARGHKMKAPAATTAAPAT
jgi:hypothetical protein